MKENNLTVQNVVDKIGCSHSTILKIRKGLAVSKKISAKIFVFTKGQVNVLVRNRGRSHGFVVKNPVSTFKHELSYTREYQVWMRMRRMCYSPSFCQYKNYGARGVTVCAAWKYDPARFVEDMGRIPKGCRSLVLNEDCAEFNKESCSWQRDARGKRRDAQNSTKSKRVMPILPKKKTREKKGV